MNENINLPRKSMKGVVLLFTKKIRVDSEEYLYSNIDSVKVTIEGVPNSVFSQGIPKSRFFSEAKRIFRLHDNEMSLRSFYKDQFALVIDLRSTQDNHTHGTGKKIMNTQSGILLEITKRVTTADVVCQTFVLSDALLTISLGSLSSIQY